MAVALFLLEADSSQSLARQRVFRDRLNPLDAYNNAEFISRYRITKNIFVQLEEKVSTFLRRSAIQSSVIPPTTQLAAALMFLETGSFQTVVASSHGISQPSVSRCICTVSDALCFHAKDFIVFPNESGQFINQPRFSERYSFPKVIGCVDGTHVPILAPPINEDIFVNRKNFHSINIQAICDSKLKFIDIVAKWPGSTAFIWRQSEINQRISNGEIPIVNGWFLGDSGYPLRPNLLTPILSPTTPGQRWYNRAFLNTRKNIECAFGLWKSRWRSMDKTGGTLCYSPERVCRLAVATMVLHNICIDHGLELEHDTTFSIMQDDTVNPPDATTPAGNIVRQSVITEYFD